jgi:pilus assembly protein Flp/PilA
VALLRPREYCGRTMFMRLLRSFVRNDVGATAIEYALLCTLIAVVLIVALGNLGTGLSSEFSEVSGAIK